MSEVAQPFFGRHASRQDEALEELTLRPPRLGFSSAAQVLELVVDHCSEDAHVQVGSEERPLEHRGPAIEVDDAPESAAGLPNGESVDAPNRIRIRSEFGIDEPDGDSWSHRQQA